MSCRASLMLAIEPQLVGLRLGQILEVLPVEHHLDSGTRADSIALLQAWQSDDYWEPRDVKQTEVDVVLKFAEAVLSATKSRMQGT